MIETIKPNWVAPPGVCAYTTTRAGGVSQVPFDSLNLALHVGDDPVHVAQNRELLQQALNLPAEPCWINQTHGTHAVTLELDSSRDADAAITRLPGVVAVVMFELTAVAPNFLFLAALTLSVMLVFSRAVVSEAPWAPLASFAMSVVILIFGPAIGPFDSDTGAQNMVYRLFELGIAAIYSAAAIFVLEAFRPTAPKVTP